jgi:hypothetical protein
MSAFMCLKAIEKYDGLTHIILYTNTVENSNLVKIYIDEILKTNIIDINKLNIYNKALHSKYHFNFNNEIEQFKKSKYGIISSIYIFGEGFNLPELNGCCFAENMESDIRVVQCALRPNRLNKKNQNKVAYIVIPSYENKSNNYFEKVKTIISKLSNVDSSIEQKIKLVTSKNSNSNNNNLCLMNNDFNLEENVEELLKIKLRLKHSKTLKSDFSQEQDEYNYVKQLNKELNIKSKEEYILSENRHEMFIFYPEKYFTQNGVWNNWYDFIGYDTNKFIQNKQNWINFCKEKNINSLQDYENLCNEHECLPRNPHEFYNGFTNISNELDFHINRR